MSTTANADLQTVWCVKYALTRGVFEVQGEFSSGGRFFMLDGYQWTVLHSRHYCFTLSDALIAAEKLRAAKISSLKKQIAKLKVQPIKTTRLQQA